MSKPDDVARPSPTIHTESKLDRFAMIAAWLSYGMCLVLFRWSFSIERCPDKFWVAVLFSLPFLSHLFGLTKLTGQKRTPFSDYYVISMIICLLTYCWSWKVYAENMSDPLFTADASQRNVAEAARLSLELERLSIWMLMFIATLSILSIIMTAAIIKSRSDATQGHRRAIWLGRVRDWLDRHLKELSEGVSKEKPLALLFFFTVFLSVSYLFAFALAFHDKCQSLRGKPALYMKNVDDSKASSSGSAPNGSSNPAQSTGSTQAQYAFQFEEGKALPAIENASTQGVPLDRDRRENLRKRQARTENDKNMNDLISQVKTLDGDGHQIRISIIGHANETPAGGSAYQSNYELAQARADNVKVAITHQLAKEKDTGWRNIQWQCSSSSNEAAVRPFKDEIEKRENKPKGRIAEVELQSFDEPPPIPAFKGMSIIDYVYFANYTITTTGYGDIIPNTSYAKFVCSLANIFEVFFLVVLFNAVLALKPSGNRDRKRNREILERIQMLLSHPPDPNASTRDGSSATKFQRSGASRDFDPGRD